MASFFVQKDFLVKMDNVTASTEQDDKTFLCILNTCTVTQKSEQKARRIIRLLLKKYPFAVILVTGCYAQTNPMQILQIDSRIAVIGGQIKSRIAKLPDFFVDLFKKNEFEAKQTAEFINQTYSKQEESKYPVAEDAFKLSTTSFLAHSRAAIKIQDGCNNNCSYCAIHIARGKSVSLEASEVIKRVQKLEDEGHEEVVLTSINIGQYKSEYNNSSVNFARLLQLLLENTSKINFRISSLYPEVVTEEFCQIIKSERIRPHFHLSVQSGSDKILREMNRVYKSEQVKKACDLLRIAKEKPFIACDIITGFPGETDDDFDQTIKLCEYCNFSWIHAFPFSERPGTPAATMKNKVPQSISGKRAEELNKIAINSKINFIDYWKNKKLTAILETSKNTFTIQNQKKIYTYHAVTENFIHCQIQTEKELSELERKSINIKITTSLPEKIQKGGEIEASAELI